MNSKVVFKDGMHFMGELNGFDVPVDAAAEVGGKDKGPRPKGLMLTALAGCTAMDVVSMLRKMRVEFDGFSVEVDAGVTEEHPVVFDGVKIIYRFTGSGLEAAREKVEKAVRLSQERYCGASAMLAKVTQVDWEIVIE